MVSRTRKVAVWVYLGAMFFLLGVGTPIEAAAAPYPVLRKVEIVNASKFLRFRFLFGGKLPTRTGAYIKERKLILLFAGARNTMPKNIIPVKGGVATNIAIRSLPKGLKVVINLKTPRVEYVKYQRKTPPQIVVSLRKTTKYTAPRVQKRPRKIQVVKKGEIPSKTKQAKTKQPSERKRDYKEETKRQEKVLKKPRDGERKPLRQSTTENTSKHITEKSQQAKEDTPGKSEYAPAKSPEVRVLFGKAQEAFNAKDYRKAEKLAWKVMKKAPKTKEGETCAFFWAKSLYLRKGFNERGAIKASEAYKKILESYPKAPWTDIALMDLLHLYKSIGFYNQAIDVGQEVIQRYPNSSKAEEAMFLIGQLQLLKQSFAEAEKTLRRYLSKYPNGKFAREATYFLGDALYYQGDVARAVEIYQRALQRWSQASATDFKTLENMARIFEKNGQNERALDLMFTALNISATEKQKPKLMLKIASLYERINRCREALKIYSKIIAQYPKTREGIKAMLKMAALAQKHPGIRYKGFNYGPDPYFFPLQAYDKIIKESKDPFAIKKALLQKGRLLMEKDPEKAVATLLRLTQTYPNSPEAKEARIDLIQAFANLIIHYEKKGHPKRCVETYRRYQKAGLKKDDPILLHVFGCFLKMGAISSAEKVLEQIKREDLPQKLRKLYDYNTMLLAFHKKSYKETIAKAIAFLKKYPKTKKEKEIIRLLRIAFARLDSKKDSPLIASSLKELLIVTQKLPAKQEVERLFVLFIKELDLRQKRKEALALLTWYLKTFPESPACPRMNQIFGDIAYRMGQYRRAEVAYQAALKSSRPKVEQAYLHYRIAMCSMKRGRYKDAKDSLDEAEKLVNVIKSQNASKSLRWLRREIVLQKAELLFMQGKTQKAIEAYRIFVEKAPPGGQRDWALYRLGTLYERTGNLKQLKSTYERLGSRASDPFWKRNAEDLKTTLGWFIQHANEFQATKRER